MWKFTPVLIMLFFLYGGNFAYADTITRSPDTVGTYDQVIYTVTITDTNIFTQCSQSNSEPYWTITSPQGAYSQQQYPFSQNTGTFTLRADNLVDVTQVVADCGTQSGSLSNVEYINGEILFTLNATTLPPPPPPNSTTTPITASTTELTAINTTLQTIAIIMSVMTSLFIATTLTRLVKS